MSGKIGLLSAPAQAHDGQKARSQKFIIIGVDNITSEDNADPSLLFHESWTKLGLRSVVALPFSDERRVSFRLDLQAQ